MRYISLCLLCCLLFSCKQETKTTDIEVPLKENQEKVYPEDLKKVFDAHGGLDRWNNMHSMSYHIIKGDELEKQWIDLKNRRERTESSTSKTGFDGTQYWIEADSTSNKDPIFYTNLMFYFFAQPFVLADEGINYEKVEDLNFDGIDYPGFRISYKDNIGVSPKDEYFIHYHPETHQMEWLGYTVTYKSDKPSDRIGWIKYEDWSKTRLLLLPGSLKWYNTENNLPTTERSVRRFEKLAVSEKEFPETQFIATSNARIVEK